MSEPSETPRCDKFREERLRLTGTPPEDYLAEMEMDFAKLLERELSEKSRELLGTQTKLEWASHEIKTLESETGELSNSLKDAEEERDALKKQVDAAFKLLNAVTDSGCNDVDGKNWYDARTALLSQPSNTTP